VTKRKPGLSLDPKNGDFVLRRTTENGNTRSITLSRDDVLTLAQSTQRLRDHILAQHSPAGGTISMVAVTPVVQTGLNVDVLSGDVFLTMVSSSGAQATFSFPQDIARNLADRISARLAQMRAARPTRQ
jgi:hypothetical protein